MGFVFDLTLASSAEPKMLFITQQPTKTNYTAGEVFDPAGMQVSVTYTNGMVKTVTDYAYSPTTALDDTVNEITVSYTEKGRTVTATVPILVETSFVGIAITKPPNKTIYNYGETFNSAGMEVTATFSNGSTQLVSGWTVDTTTLTTVGTQTITVSYTADGVTKMATLNIAVNNVKLALPTQSGTLTYTGSSQSPTWNNYNTTQLTIGGTTSGINATSYAATFTPKYGYCWEDNSTSAKNATWLIGKASISVVPSQSGTLTYTGSSQSPTWNNYNTTQLTIGGTTSATNTGTYTATFTPTANYKWADGSSSKSVTWTIGGATISVVPSQSGTLTYNGSSQSPTWSNYNSSQLTIGGTTSSTNAGTYTATFTPKGNYTWSDGTTTVKSVTWTIGKATPTVSVPPSLGTISQEETFTVTSNSGGTLTVTSADTSIVNVLKLTNTTFKAIPVSDGTTSVSVKFGETANYKESVGTMLSVTVAMSGEITDSWATISQRTTAGTAANYYTVGSWKNVQLNGYYGVKTSDYSNVDTTKINITVKAFIIGIDHNPTHCQGVTIGDTNTNASNKKLIHWQLGKIDNKQVGFYDGMYGSNALNGNRSPFAMNVYDAAGIYTDFPSTMLFDFLNTGTQPSYADNRGYEGYSFFFQWVLPNDLKAVLVNTAIDYYSQEKNLKGTFYAKMILPSIIELLGKDSSYNVNTQDSTYEQQYDYYANGNSIDFYKYAYMDAYLSYWTRTQNHSDTFRFAYVGRISGSTKVLWANRDKSYGITPIFFT